MLDKTFTKFMLTLELAGNTARMNDVSPMLVILLSRQLLQNHLILNLAKARYFNIEKYITKLY